MKKRKPNKYQKLISKFCEDTAVIYTDVKKIKIQMFLAKKLLALVPDEEFWDKFPVHKNCKNLNWFFTDEGESLIRDQSLSEKVDIPLAEEHKMEEKKVGEDFKIQEKKPKTIREFLEDA